MYRKIQSLTILFYLTIVFISSSKAESAFEISRLANGYLDQCSFSSCGFKTADRQTVKLTQRGWAVSSRIGTFDGSSASIREGLNITLSDGTVVSAMIPLSGIVLPQPGRAVYYSDVSNDGKTVLGVSAGSVSDGNGFEKGAIFFIQDTVGSFADLTKQPFLPPVFSKDGAIVYVNEGKVTLRKTISSSPIVLATLDGTTAVDAFKLTSELIQANSNGVVVGRLPGRVFVYDPSGDTVRTKVSIDGDSNVDHLPNLGNLLQVLSDVAVFERGLLNLTNLTFQYHTDTAPRIYSPNKIKTIIGTDDEAYYSEDGVRIRGLECLLPAKFKLVRVFKVDNDGSLIVSGYLNNESFGVYKLTRGSTPLVDADDYCYTFSKATINKECRKYFDRYDIVETNFHSAVPPWVYRGFEVNKKFTKNVSGCYLNLNVTGAKGPLKRMEVEVNNFFYSRYGTQEYKVRGFDELRTNSAGNVKIPLKASFLRQKVPVVTAFRPKDPKGLLRFSQYPIAIRRK